MENAKEKEKTLLKGVKESIERHRSQVRNPSRGAGAKLAIHREAPEPSYQFNAFISEVSL